MLKTAPPFSSCGALAYHLGEGRVLKTWKAATMRPPSAYHLGEGRVLKTPPWDYGFAPRAYHLGEGRVLKTSMVPISM